jgi:hypothetical protein
LITALVMMAVAMVVFAGELNGPALTATVIDDAVVGWLVQLHLPGLVAFWRVLAAPSSWWVLYALDSR